MIKDMTDVETVTHIRKYVEETHSMFSWPTDACGYDQHVKFVRYRNKFWKNNTEFKTFCLQYADLLESGVI